MKCTMRMLSVLFNYMVLVFLRRYYQLFSVWNIMVYTLNLPKVFG